MKLFHCSRPSPAVLHYDAGDSSSHCSYCLLAHVSHTNVLLYKLGFLMVVVVVSCFFKYILMGPADVA